MSAVLWLLRSLLSTELNVLVIEQVSAINALVLSPVATLVIVNIAIIHILLKQDFVGFADIIGLFLTVLK